MSATHAVMIASRKHQVELTPQEILNPNKKKEMQNHRI